MRIAMMGSGGLGAYFGGLLAQAGEDVTFIARGANLDALRTAGLTVKRIAADDLHMDVRATDDPREVGAMDLIWFCVKTYDLDAAVQQAAPLVGPETLALTTQNGVDAPDQVASVLGQGAVLAGAAMGGATLLEPGVVEQKTARIPVKLGPLVGGASERVEQVCRTLRAADIEADLSPDILREVWEKFIFACVSLGLITLTRLTGGALFACPESVELARGIMTEAEAVGVAKGIGFESGLVEHLIQLGHAITTSTPSARGSMYFDLLPGAPPGA